MRAIIWPGKGLAADPPILGGWSPIRCEQKALTAKFAKKTRKERKGGATIAKMYLLE